ncbi:MAG: hypothetical protein ACLQM8_23495 [Limisphaerales bacterium]
MDDQDQFIYFRTLSDYRRLRALTETGRRFAVMGGDLLHLVRLGIRAADDPLVRDSIAVMDRLLKCDLPQGPCRHRYNHDGYGQKDAGGAFDGTGVGRARPILTGERGHCEPAAGRDPKPFIAAMEKFANEGGMISEQLWDAEDVGGMRRGLPTGAAMPLCWAHAEYVSLARSAHDGVCFDRVEPAFQRYVVHPVRAGMRFGASATRLAECLLANSCASSLRPTRASPGQPINGAVIEFTFLWKEAKRPEGRNYSVKVRRPK